jgi:hypothetical protein
MNQNESLTELLYPATVDRYGDLAVTSDYATQAKQAIISALSTVKMERVYRDNYGLEPTLFKSQQLLSAIRAAKEALSIILEEYPDVPYTVTGYLDDGITIVNVSYAVNGTTATEQLRVSI